MADNTSEEWLRQNVETTLIVKSGMQITKEINKYLLFNVHTNEKFILFEIMIICIDNCRNYLLTPGHSSVT
jgi:hypothetical protein